MSRVRVPDGVPSLGANKDCAQRNPLTGGTKYSKVLDASQIQIVGVFNGEGPPVPIPNTEVKLTSADNTCLETDREDRSMPTRKAHSFGCELFAFPRGACFAGAPWIYSLISHRALPGLVEASGWRRASPREFFRRTCRRKNESDSFHAVA